MKDPFEGKEPVKGLEHLGRAIVDSNGQPSGSPANYEFRRGRATRAELRDIQEVATEIAARLG